MAQCAWQGRRGCEHESVVIPWQLCGDELSECTSADRRVARCLSSRLNPRHVCFSRGGVIDYDNLAMHATTQCNQRKARAGALVIHHPAWVGHHTGGSGSTPTAHRCRYDGRLWVAQHQPQAQHRMSHAKISGQTL